MNVEPMNQVTANWHLIKYNTEKTRCLYSKYPDELAIRSLPVLFFLLPDKCLAD